MTSSQIPDAIAMPCPFANPIDGTTIATVTEVSTTASESTVNFPKGFGENYAAPSSEGGKYVTRGEMNGVGKALGTDVFRMKCYGLNLFDASFAAQIGGYPYGAVLDYLEDGKLFKIMSLKDNNTTVPPDSNAWQILNVDNGTLDSSVDLITLTSSWGADYSLSCSCYSSIILVFYANFNGCIVVSGSATPKTNDTRADNHVDFYVGAGIALSAGQDSFSAAMALNPPQPAAANSYLEKDWKLIYTYGEFYQGVTADATSSHAAGTFKWEKVTPSAPVVEKGKYYAIALLSGSASDEDEQAVMDCTNVLTLKRID